MLKRLTATLVAPLLLLQLLLSVAQALPGASRLAGEVQEHGNGVRVASATARYQLDNGALLELERGAEIAPRPRLKLQLAVRSPSVAVPGFNLLQGTVRVRIPEAKTNQLAVLIVASHKTSLLAKGGEALVQVSNGATTVANYRGTSIVSVDTDFKPLPAGFARTISSEQPRGKKRAIPERPEQLAFSRGLSLAGGALRLSWRGAHDARFLVVLKSNHGAQQSHIVRGNALQLNGLPPGNYQAQVMALDDSGLRSQPSEAASTTVLGLQLPKGAVRASDGTIMLPKYSSVRLLQAQQLELAFSDDTGFVAAPEYVGLARQRPTTITLRARVSAESKQDKRPDGVPTLKHASVQLRLEPLSPLARVHFQHVKSTFPSSGLPVQIELQTAAGQPLPPSVPVEVSLTVNLKAPPLSWKRSATKLETRIAKPAEAGPYVVRVEVKDSRGERIALDMVELD